MKFRNFTILSLLTIMLLGASVSDRIFRVGTRNPDATNEIHIGNQFRLRGNSTTNEMEFSNNSGTNWGAIGSGSSHFNYRQWANSGTLTFLEDDIFVDRTSTLTQAVGVDFQNIRPVNAENLGKIVYLAVAPNITNLVLRNGPISTFLQGRIFSKYNGRNVYAWISDGTTWNQLGGGNIGNIQLQLTAGYTVRTRRPEGTFITSPTANADTGQFDLGNADKEAGQFTFFRGPAVNAPTNYSSDREVTMNGTGSTNLYGWISDGSVWHQIGNRPRNRYHIATLSSDTTVSNSEVILSDMTVTLRRDKVYRVTLNAEILGINGVESAIIQVRYTVGTSRSTNLCNAGVDVTSSIGGSFNPRVTCSTIIKVGTCCHPRDHKIMVAVLTAGSNLSSITIDGTGGSDRSTHLVVEELNNYDTTASDSDFY